MVEATCDDCGSTVRETPDGRSLPPHDCLTRQRIGKAKAAAQRDQSCANADKVTCENPASGRYMMKAHYLGHVAWVWVPLCTDHAPGEA